MKNATLRIFVFIYLFLYHKESSAQFTSTYSVGINAGAFIYNGDLSPWRSGSLKTPAFVFGLSGNKNLSPNVSARLELNFGKLRGDEAKYTEPEYRQYRAFAFTSRVAEIIIAAEYSPLGRARRLSPYVFGGIGYAGLKVQRDYSRFAGEYFAATEPALLENLQKDIDHDLPKSALIFPVGIGLKYSLSEKLSLHTEAAQRFTTSDYIDGFSEAGNPNRKDSYSKYSIGLRLAVGGKDRYGCPVVRY